MHDAAQLHTSQASLAYSKFAMPAMSPTMTEGGIASWKKNEGDTFAAGDVLLEIVRRFYGSMTCSVPDAQTVELARVFPKIIRRPTRQQWT
jgi:hypothetical protein